MENNKIKSILTKYARLVYFDRSESEAELESIKSDAATMGYDFALFREALVESVDGNTTKALEISDRAISIAYSNNNEFLIEELSMYRGVLYRSLNQNDSAFKCYLDALKYKPTARAYNNMADLFLVEGDYIEADKYLRKALELLMKVKDKSFFEQRLLNIVYTNLSEAELKSGKIKEAKNSAYSCLEWAKKSGDLFAQAYGHDLLANILVVEERYEEAYENYHNAETIYRKCDPQAQKQILVYIEDNLRLQSKCLFLWGKYEDALAHINLIGSLTNGDYELLIEIYRTLDDKDATYDAFEQYFEFLKQENIKRTEIRREHFKTKVSIFESEKKANQYELLYKHTKSMSGIGKEIISAEKLDDVLFAIYNHIDNIMKFDTLALAYVNDETIEYNWVLENHKRMDNFKVEIHDKNSFSSWVVRNKKSIKINDTLTVEELAKYKENAEMVYIGQETGSMIVCPIIMKDKVYGVINIQSVDKYRYNEYDLEVINMLASFIAVAMKNWEDANALISANEKLETLSKTDALTGISNRHVLSEIVENLFKADQTNNKISVVMIDIDYFKEYNDTYGHIEGDRCIIAIVDVLRKKLDVGHNRLFRYGGDEFVSIIPFIDSEEVYSILEETRHSIENLKIDHSKSEVSDYVTCTFGFTTVIKGSMDYQKVFYLADEAMYQAKGNGKNRIAYKKSED